MLRQPPRILRCTIKTIIVFPSGTLTTEPTDIKVGEPDPQLFDPLNHYTVDTTSYEAKLRKVEQQGDSKAAAELREQISRAKQPKTGM